jgi:holo-[acyl-carrier protein] synthase
MIIGVGADLCRIERIRRSLDHFGQSWIDELFTTKEAAWCSSGPDPGLAFARLFCCKEACAKALGTGFTNNVDPRDIEFSPLIEVTLHRGARTRLKRLTPLRHHSTFLVSSSSADPFTMSVALLDAVPMAMGTAPVDGSSPRTAA